VFDVRVQSVFYDVLRCPAVLSGRSLRPGVKLRYRTSYLVLQSVLACPAH